MCVWGGIVARGEAGAVHGGGQELPGVDFLAFTLNLAEHKLARITELHSPLRTGCQGPPPTGRRQHSVTPRSHAAVGNATSTPLSGGKHPPGL